jgi:hypothetical protein
MWRNILLSLGIASLLAACASPQSPPLTATSPASPAAAPGARAGAVVSLRPDALTAKTREMLSAGEQVK